MGFASKIKGAGSGLKGKFKGFGSKAKGKWASAKQSETGQKLGSAATRGKEWTKEYGAAFGEKAGGALKSGAGAAGGALKAGGGFALSNWKKIALFLLIGFIAIMVILWFLAVGGGQAVLPGIGVGFQLGWERMMQSYSIRSFMNLVKNPFGVGPTGGEYEDQGSAVVKTPPNQAFSVELRGVSESVILGQDSVIAIVKINNLGGSKISIVDVTIGLRSPFDESDTYPQGCLIFPEGNTKTVTDIPPYSSKEIVFSRGVIDLVCVDISMRAELKPNVPVGGIVITTTAKTYYPTSSRLAVERIDSDYGLLLIKNNVLRQQKTGAIYRTGSAMIIDMDIGAQPIFDSITETAILMKWQNMGSGKMSTGIGNDEIPLDIYTFPYLMIITPSQFGPCEPFGYVSTSSICAPGTRCIACDEVLLAGDWCRNYSFFYQYFIEGYGAELKPSFDWACDQIGKGNVSVCITSALTEEFNIFSCMLNLPGPITTNETRITDYITAIAIYPYEVSAAKSISAYCLEGSCTHT